MENNNLSEKTTENIAPEAEVTSAPESAKKPLPWWIFAIIGAVVVVIVAVVLIIALGKDKCENHIDKNDDFLCDVCGVDFDDGLEIETSNVTFTVKDEAGNALSGVKFYVSGGGKVYTLTTADDGTVKQELALGKYDITYDYTTINSGCMPDTSVLNLADGITSLAITIIDNNPNGTLERPFFISENVTPFSIAAGEVIYYRLHASVGRELVINNEGITVIYNDEEYTAEGGKVTVIIEGGVDESAVFAVKNVSGAAIDTQIEMVFPEGSSENPIVIGEDTIITVNMEPQAEIHYKWIATRTGVLVAATAFPKSEVNALRVVANNVPISSGTGSAEYAYLMVKEGETISFTLSSESKEQASVTFGFAVYAGTEQDPVHIMQENVAITLEPSSSIVFCSCEAKKLSINDTENFTLSYAGSQVLPGVNGATVDFATEDIFVLTNTATERKPISMSFEFADGSLENPVAITEGSNTVSIPGGSELYCSFTATANAVVKFDFDGVGAGFIVSKVLDNGTTVTYDLATLGYAYVYVAKGDVISGVLSNNTDAITEASFDFSSCASTDARPLSVSEDDISLYLSLGAVVVLDANEGETVVIESNGKYSVIYNGDTVTPDENGKITIDFTADAKFAIRHADTKTTEVTVKLQ